MEQTCIPGKDAPLETSIEFMQNRLRELGFTIEEKNWLNPVPEVWSVHIHDKHCPLLFTNGKGSSRKAALASALGEFFERLGCNYFFADYYLGNQYALHFQKQTTSDEDTKQSFVHYPEERWFSAKRAKQWPKGLLDDAKLRKFYNPDNELSINKLYEIHGNHKEMICGLPFERQRDGKKIWFPLNIVANLYVSNGMSAGNSIPEARVQALSEIFERTVKFKVIAEGISLPRIPDTVLARYPGIQAGIKSLEDAGFVIQCYDASLGGQYPVLNITLLNPKDQGCYASFGAHPNFEVALERTLTELLQGRALKSLSGFPEPSNDLDDVASAENLETHFIDSSGLLSWRYFRVQADYPFSDWNYAQDESEAEFHWLCESIHKMGKDIYIADYPHLGVYSCRIIVPGLSEIYPLDELVWNNNNIGVSLRKPLLNLAEQPSKIWQNLLKTLDNEGFDEQQTLSQMLGLAPDKQSLWAHLRVGELRAMLALALHEQEAAVDMCEWVLHYNALPAERLRLYRCIKTLLQLDIETLNESQDTLLALYGKKILKTAVELISGERAFAGLRSVGAELKGFKMHHKLLDAYAKLQQARGQYYVDLSVKPSTTSPRESQLPAANYALPKDD